MSILDPPENPFELVDMETLYKHGLGYRLNIHRKLPTPLYPGNRPLSRNHVSSKDFFDDLVCTTKPIEVILQDYDRSRVDLLKSDIMAYFCYLQGRLRQQDLHHDDIVKCNRVNYVSYGSRFWDWLTESDLFDRVTLHSYSVLLYAYLNKFPLGISQLHEKLHKANLGLVKNQPKEGHFDYKMVSFKRLDFWSLHNSLKKIHSLTEQQNHFNSSVYPSNKPWKNFLIQELQKCLNHYDIDFFLLKLGTLCNGASLVGRFEFVLAFDYHGEWSDDSEFDLNSKSERIPDWSTLYLTLKAIRRHFYQNYKIKVNEFIDDKGLSIKFDFGHLSRHLESFECYIQLDARYASSWAMIRSLSKCDNRFMEMTLILNYWATCIGFYDDQHFSHISFALLIAFSLQQTDPPVFKPLDNFIDHCDETEFTFSENYWTGTGASENKQTTGELIVEFFRYYYQFEFENCVISPGEASFLFDCYDSEDECFVSYIRVLNPFSLKVDESIRCTKESMKQFQNCLSTYLTELKLSSTNYLQVLTNPEYFNLQSDIYNCNTRFKNVPTVALNCPTDSASRIDFETNLAPIECNQVEIKVVHLPVQVKEAQLSDVSPLSTSSDPVPEAVESKVMERFTEIKQENNSTRVKPSSPIISRDEANDSMQDCDEDDDEDQCRVM